MSIEANFTKEETIIYKSGDTKSIELTQQNAVGRLLCRLEVNHTNATALFKTDHFFNLLNLTVLVNGKDTRKNIPSEKCFFNQMIFNQKSPTVDLKTANGTGVTSTLYFTVDFSPRGAGLPTDAAEFSQFYNTFKLIANWTNAAACSVSGVTINSAELFVSSQQFHKLEAPVANGQEVFTQNIETYLTKEITSTSPNFAIKLEPGQKYSRILIVAKEDGDRVDTIVNNVKLISGQKTHMELDAKDIREFMKDFHRIHPTEDLSGLYLIDELIRRRISDVLDTTTIQHNTLTLVLDVTKGTGTCTVDVHTEMMKQVFVPVKA